ncbi:MAG: TIGR03936 family radical SAM-associated protein [Isosphaeraceae bacterium]
MTTPSKLRLRFAKRGNLRLVSHHDLMRCLERMLRRARIPVALSQGFTPRPRVVFALPLALGIEGLDEVVDLELSQPVEPEDVLCRLRRVAPAGFDWTLAQVLDPGSAPPRPLAAEYCLQLPEERREPTRQALSALLASASCQVTRRRPGSQRVRTIDLRTFLLRAELTDEGMLWARLKVSPDGSARPEELLECLGLRDLLDQGAYLVRTQVELA